MAVSEARVRALDHLRAGRNADGSWGYLPRDPGAGEPTLFAAAAGAGAAIDWLGSAPIGWAELLLPAALSRVGDAAVLRERAVSHILELRGLPVELPDPSVYRHDATLPGWSWVDGTAAWVEPTAFATLSLKRGGHAGHPRVGEGERLLVDRQCADGGWNYGNPTVMGHDQDSEPVSSGWAALALPAGPAVERALAYLHATTLARPSTSGLALAILAHVAHRAEAGALVEPLLARQRADGGFGRHDRTALAACALGAVEEGTHAFAA